MKIIAVGRNYAQHAKELGNETPENPVIFLKPDTALLKNNQAFYHPEFSKEIHYEVEVVIRICKEGKHISPKFASGYYDAIGLGIDFTARDLQRELKQKSLPWELAKGFDGSAPVSKLLPLTAINDINKVRFCLNLNGNTVQKGNTQNMLFSFDQLICYISTFITLRKGDLVFTGTPEGVGKVNIGDHLQGFLEDEKLLDFFIK